ncbi:hypothetical protein QWZ16_11200 [Vibrio ostreicida]|uniref:Uncharacterized protein n=1 Tax=Vibrio ostreicida TaxID=526588 RepID=A0ABT8BW02_9VIBR|nr:hypothetical protein [Vibrio ostreicida]MDN3610268.1 hypothetical protein [Vibrio ostreicida]
MISLFNPDRDTLDFISSNQQAVCVTRHNGVCPFASEMAARRRQPFAQLG